MAIGTDIKNLNDPMSTIVFKYQLLKETGICWPLFLYKPVAAVWAFCISLLSEEKEFSQKKIAFAIVSLSF
jgi:hypothetical protein